MSEATGRDTTFDKIGPAERLWLTVRNTGKSEELEIVLEVNGVEKIIQSHYIPGLSPSEGITLHSTQLTWLLSHGK